MSSVADRRNPKEPYKRFLAGSQHALLMAQHNVARHYDVVGVLEDLRGTVRVLEAVLPGVFGGAGRAYRRLGLRSRLVLNRTPGGAGGPSGEALAVLRRNMSAEYQFYHFVRERLARQMAALGIEEGEDDDYDVKGDLGDRP